MDHKDITIFLELVRCRNISKTAETCICPSQRSAAG